MRILDADLSFPDQPFLWGLRPADSLMHLATANEDGQDFQVVLQGPLGVKLLSLDIDFSRLAALPEQARHRLLTSLMAFEADTQLMLVDTPADFTPNSRLIFQLAHQIVVLVPSDPLGMIDAYAVIKGILALRPGAPVGMVVYNVKMMVEAQAVAHKMTQAVTEFLNSNILDMGFLYADLNITKSISQRKPLVLTAVRSRAAECLGRIAEKVWTQQESRARVGNGSFFEAINEALESCR